MILASVLFTLFQLPTIPPSPVSRIVVTPAVRTVAMGDSLKLHVQALDAAGKPVPNVRILYAARGSAAHVDTSGLVVGGSMGKMFVTITAIVPGSKPMIEQFDMHVVPGPASRIDVSPRVAKLVVGQRLHLEGAAYAKSNDRRGEAVLWKSSAPAVLRVDRDGLLEALSPGKATITATAGPASTPMTIDVLANTIGSVEITPDKPSVRQGDVVRFKAVPKDRTGKVIDGLTPSWTFSPGKGVMESDGAFVGYEPGQYFVRASFGTQSADAVLNLEQRDVRRPVTVVSRIGRTAFLTSEVWIHPNGKVAYLGTHGGGDRVYAIDITNPAKPIIVDSIQANTRLVNDMMTTPDGNYMVFTREGAADRKNGIVIADTHDPLHPKAISEFTDGVTAGVHSAYVNKQDKYGTFVYLTNDGTGAMHVIDINDPAHPKQVAEWRPRKAEGTPLYVHDIDVRDGLLYASWWDDGLIILDVGNGIKGGSPSNPQLVTQYKYNLDAMYKQVEDESGPGFARGTHTAWRHKNYVFIADEVYRATPVKGAKDAAADRMYGRLQVVDVSDLQHPKSVAWYEPEFGGVHNVWVAGDTLYMGAYNAGFRAFDISGELRGDLRAQGREIASLNTADMDGVEKNTAMTWGVVVNPKDGLAYVNDFNNGLWVVRIEPKKLTP